MYLSFIPLAHSKYHSGRREGHRTQPKTPVALCNVALLSVSSLQYASLPAVWGVQFRYMSSKNTNTNTISYHPLTPNPRAWTPASAVPQGVSLLGEDGPDKRVVIDLSVSISQCQPHRSYRRTPRTLWPWALHPHERLGPFVATVASAPSDPSGTRETHCTGNPFNNSSTSSSDIFSPSCVRTYRSSPAPINPFPALSNTWKPLMNSSTRVMHVSLC